MADLRWIRWRWLPWRIKRRLVERGIKNGTYTVEVRGTNVIGYQPAGEVFRKRYRWDPATEKMEPEDDDPAA